MTVLSVDLAYKQYHDVGVVVLRRLDASIGVVPIDLESAGLSGTPEVAQLASFLASFATEVNASSILIDGPQAWKAADNGLEHSRHCERELATPGKMGLPGVTKPATYLDFSLLSIGLFDQLAELSFPRLATTGDWPKHVAIESFPTAAWRSLGLTPLPAKAKATASGTTAALEALRGCFTLDVRGDLTHDQLQATAAGLAGIALEGRNLAGLAFAGVEPFLEDGTWREGYILSPTREAAELPG